MARRLEEGDEQRDRYLEALENGYRFNGYVSFDKRQATDPIAKYLGLDEKGFIELMIKYLRAGGRLERVDEWRENWRHLWRFHFDLWPEVAAKDLYVETRFADAPHLDNREIIVVSVHPPDDVAWSRWNK